MAKKCVPMIHVPDVQATVQWYQRIGFRVVETFGDGNGGLSFAILSFGDSEIMFNAGGRKSTERRREVDLYAYSEDIDALYAQLRERVDVVETPHDTFYGMRELIVRDLNGFWLTFGEVSAGAMLMQAVDERDIQRVREIAARSGLTPERLSAALTDALQAVDASPAATEIVQVLERAGAVRPPAVGIDVLERYVGTYRSDEGIEVRVNLNGHKLLAFPDEGRAVRLMPLTDTTFKPLELSDAVVSFDVEGGKAVLKFTQGSKAMLLQRERDA